MFFLMGITPWRRDFDFSQMDICSRCGKYGRYQVFMTCMVLNLFFIPCFRWNRHYYVKKSCCGALYELDPEVGKRIARGEDVTIRPEDLTFIQDDSGGWNGTSGWNDGWSGTSGWNDGWNGSSSQNGGWNGSSSQNGDRNGAPGWNGGLPDRSAGGNGRKRRTCPNCGYSTEEDFDYCPKCGHKMNG